ncbi:MAG: hypothetical protein ACERKD_15890 [Prolixibacteraceae bacterium]
MKNLKLISVLLIVWSLVSTSCIDSIVDGVTDSLLKGSASLTIDGELYDVLATSVIQTSDGLTFSLIDEATETPFMVAMSPLPEIGETDTLNLEGNEESAAILFYGSPIPDYSVLLSGAGTVKRTSNLEYEIDATLFGGDTLEDQFSLKGTITVGTVLNF